MASADSGDTHHTRFCRFSKEASEAGSGRSHSYEYDVYIFYEIEDHEFVFQHIVSHLDNDYSGAYKCCYEIKDFMPGSYYVDAILAAMKRSYWTFLVFSEASVGKGYSKFLYHQTVCSARNLVPIKIDDCEIPEELENIKTVLDFTVMPPEVFYERLVSVISEATPGLLPDPRPTTIGKRKTSVLRQPQAPSATYEEETYGEGGGGQSSYVSRGSSPYFDTRLLDKNDALLIRKTSRVGSPSETLHDVTPPDLLTKEDTSKSSAESFHDNPEQYIESFQKTNLQSPIFRKFEGTLLRDILPEVRDRGDVERVNATSLVRLTRCPSPVVKRRALSLLENRLVRDDLQTAATAHGLMETEELLRQSLLGKPFQTETSDFQSARLRVYGRLLFYVAMHIEKRHLTFDMARSRSVSLVDDMATELLKQIRKLSNPMAYALMMVNHGHAYLKKLVHDMESGLSEDKISERIDELSKVADFSNFTPWYHLKKALRNEHYWVHLDVILSYVGNLAFHDSRYLQVLLRHIPELLQPSPSIRVQVSSGVMVNVARMLVSLIVRHERRDIRMAAFFGLNSPRNCPGLTAMWNFQLYNVREFRDTLKEIVEPLLLTSGDLEVRQTIYRVFFECTYLQPAALGNSNDNDSLLTEENLILNLVQKHLTYQYERVGDRLDFNASHTIRRTNAHIIEGCFNYTTSVAVKIPRMKTHGPLINPESPSPAEDLLLREMAVLGSLSHDNVLRLICRPSADFLPVHAVVEYLNGRNLLQHLQQARHACGPVRASRRQLVEKVLQVGSALVYLAERGVVHRDICAYNVLLHYPSSSRAARVKLAGFSLARKVSHKGRLEQAADTSREDSVLLRWSDPESFLQGTWSLQTDVWMFWCLVFEVFTYGAHPFPECLSAIDVPNMAGRGYCLQQPLCMPSDMHVLIQRGLQRNIQQRATIHKAVEALKELAQDWAYGDHGGNDSIYKMNLNIKYPDCPREGIERMSPRDFNTYQPNVGNTQGTRKTSTSDMACVDFKLLQTPDLIDPSAADQPHETMRLVRGRFVPINVEVFKATAEKEQVFQGLLSLKSENVCKILEFNPVGNEATLVTELDAGGGVLSALLHHPAGYRMHHVVYIMLQVLEGLHHLHTKHHIVHTDLRAQHLYAGAHVQGLDKGYFRVKIGRLARCKMLFKGVLDNEGRTVDTEPVPIDSLRWAPREVVSAPAYYSRGSDLYSVGLVWWQLLYALQVGGDPDPRLLVPHPEWRLDRDEFRRKLMSNLHPEQPARCPDWAYVLMKQCLRARYKRPTIDLLQEALTARKPFNSKLLEGVKNQLANSEFQPQVHFEEEQAAGAPYLGQYRDPLTGPTLPSCLNPEFDEGDHYYLQHARFGFHTEDHGQLLTPASDPASPAASKLHTSRVYGSNEEEREHYDFKDTYDDCIFVQEPGSDDSSIHCDDQEEEEDSLYESIDSLHVSPPARPGPAYRLQSPQPQSLQQEEPYLHYLQPALSVTPREPRVNREECPQRTSEYCQPTKESPPPGQPHQQSLVKSSPRGQLYRRSGADSPKHVQFRRQPNSDPVFRQTTTETMQKAASFVHAPITDNDHYSLVTKIFVQQTPPSERTRSQSMSDSNQRTVQSKGQSTDKGFMI